MGVRTKNRRKLLVTNRKFIWYVKEDDDSFDFILHVISEDKKIIVSYHLRQPDSTRHLIIKGKEFPGLPDAGANWIRVRCPQWETESIITPACVRSLIEWCFSSERELIFVNWLGQNIAHT